MITQETKSVKTWGGFNLAIIKVNLNHYLERIEVHTIRLTSPTLNFLLLPTRRTYWHDHKQAPNPWTPSFLDSPPNTSTPACVSLGFNGSNWIDHQGVENFFSLKTWGGFNLAIIKVNLNPLSWKNRSSYNKTYKPHAQLLIATHP